jgi:hypothetical protein
MDENSIVQSPGRAFRSHPSDGFEGAWPGRYEFSAILDCPPVSRSFYASEGAAAALATILRE